MDYRISYQEAGFNPLISAEESTEKLDGYRYAFQGQERDDEVNGVGNSYAFKYRIHDSRTGRFLSVDPLATGFPWNSPYSYAENKVTWGVDLEGLEWVYYKVLHINSDGHCHVNKTGDVEYGTGSGRLINAIQKIFTGENMTLIESHVVQSPIDGLHYIFGSEKEAYNAKLSDFNPDKRYTLEGVYALFEVTDGVGMGLQGIAALHITRKSTMFWFEYSN